MTAARTTRTCADVRGQQQAKRALEVAAAGATACCFSARRGPASPCWPAGCRGYSRSCRRPRPWRRRQCARSAGSIAFDPARWRERPFRSPHHTASGVALVGGGSNPRPGEISLAHLGVLFLDELPEFDRRVLEVLREPLESGRIHISRAARQAEFPARFQLVAAMNPCPCGYLGDPGGRCHCTAEQVLRYRARISGPLLDRIDLHVEVPRLPAGQLGAAGGRGWGGQRRGPGPGGGGAGAGGGAGGQAQQRAHHRRGQSLLPAGPGRSPVAGAGHARLGLSARAYHRVLKVARTIADLAGAEAITAAHLGEAVGYRRLDRTAPRG